MKESGIVALLLALSVFTGCSDDTDKSENEEKLVAEMAQRVKAIADMERRGDLVPRFNQPKTVACLSGEFTVASDLPEALAHGLFETQATYPVYARFANASKWDDSEKDIRGLSLKVSDVQGQTLWGATGEQDFLLNSYPALFVATPEDFLGFMRARQTGSTWSLVKFFLSPFDPHLGALGTVLKARARHDSPLDIRYWSTVPSALDSSLTEDPAPTADTRAVKYSVSPCSAYTTETTVAPGENQLREAIDAHLQQAPVCLSFGVQLQTDPASMPIEDASIVWDEARSPFVEVARMNFEKQPVTSSEALAQCEASRFNPWQSLPAHTPLGRMNAVRKAVYETGASTRSGP